MKIETVVFDLGGTLIEYAGDYEHWPELETPGFLAAYETLANNGRHLPPFLEFREAGFSLLPLKWGAAIRHEKNLRVVDLIEETLGHVGVKNVEKTELQIAATNYGAAIQAQAWVMDTAVETVQQLKAAGYKIGLVSNTMFPGTLHEADLQRFGLLDYFDALVFSADEFKWKPNADPFLHLLTELEAEAETAVYIGDDPASDVVGGRAAGMHTIYIQTSQRFAKPNGVEPHAEITHLNQLLPTLQTWATSV